MQVTGKVVVVTGGASGIGRALSEAFHRAGAAKVVVDRINGHFAEWNAADHLEGFQLSVSIGVSEWSEGDTLDEMLDRADRKMYEQKDSGRAS